jgi:hypothetical protein
VVGVDDIRTGKDRELSARLRVNMSAFDWGCAVERCQKICKVSGPAVFFWLL